MVLQCGTPEAEVEYRKATREAKSIVQKAENDEWVKLCKRLVKHSVQVNQREFCRLVKGSDGSSQGLPNAVMFGE